MVDIPILFLIFNRPDNTGEVFESIRKAGPKQLFVAGDGPRKEKENELEICLQARLIATQVDWDCEVKTLFRDENLGCRLAVSSGITWFFKHVEMGIILEDDCRPNPDFYGFCQQMLNRYSDDSRVMMVCGTNYLPRNIASQIKDSYFFSNYYPIWGWATWKRAWCLYKADMKEWPRFRETRQLSWLFSNAEISGHYQFMFNLIENGFDTWDVQWWFTCIFQNGLAIVPKYNLISNIGIAGTHSNTQGSYAINMRTHPLDLESLVHPEFVFAERYLNEMTYHFSHAKINVKGDQNEHSLAGKHVGHRSVMDVIKVSLKKLFAK